MNNKIPGRALLEAVEVFRESYKSMLLSFDEKAVLDSVGSWLRTEGHAMVEPTDDADALLTTLEIGFAFLVARGAIVPARPFSVQGKRQFDALKRISGTNPAVKQSAPSDPLAELIADNATLSAAAFKTKWILDPKRLQTYEAAIAAGKV
jgi:hypothetical protein